MKGIVSFVKWSFKPSNEIAMKMLKKIMFIGLLLWMPLVTLAQQTSWNYSAGLSSILLLSNKISGLPGIGLQAGATQRTNLTRKLEIMSEFNIYFGGTGIGAWALPYPNGTTTPTWSPSVENFFYEGVNYALGLNYDLVPNEISISAEGFIGYSGLLHIDLSDKPSSYSLIDPAKNNSYNSDLFAGLDYGVCLGGTYWLGDNNGISLRYHIGFSNFTPDLQGAKTSPNTIFVSYCYLLRDFSMSKPYKNKLLR